jgi:flagellar motility protein MotE (MotC chaperone)
MRTRKNLWTILFLAMLTIGIVALSGDDAPFLRRLPPSGILPATFAIQQEDEESSATVKGASAVAIAVPPPGGLDSVSSLVGDEPVTQEVREALRKRDQELQAREREVERRERTLRDLEKSIDAKLAELERRRKDLLSLTTQMDEQQLADLAAASKIYKSMDTQSTARIFNQMDLDLVVTVLKQVPAAKAGEILAAMIAEVEKMEAKTGGKDAGPGSESAKRLERLKEMGERLVDPTLRKP